MMTHKEYRGQKAFTLSDKMTPQVSRSDEASITLESFSSPQTSSPRQRTQRNPHLHFTHFAFSPPPPSLPPPVPSPAPIYIHGWPTDMRFPHPRLAHSPAPNPTPWPWPWPTTTAPSPRLRRRRRLAAPTGSSSRGGRALLSPQLSGARIPRADGGYPFRVCVGAGTRWRCSRRRCRGTPSRCSTPAPERPWSPSCSRATTWAACAPGRCPAGSSSSSRPPCTSSTRCASGLCSDRFATATSAPFSRFAFAAAMALIAECCLGSRCSNSR